MDNLRHSCAHLLAAAVMELWPDTKRTIGPSIESGFYYDFEFTHSISEKDFPRIEKKMKEILKTWKGFEKIEVTKEKALEEFSKNQYKKELIEEFSKEGQKLTFYKSGNYTDLCRGGHIENPKEELKNFKLLKIAGSYWRGKAENSQLTRIYGTAFPTKEELDNYLNFLEEAKKRDHKKLGLELELFMFHETSPGMVYWLPKGLIIYQELIKFWKKEHNKKNYQEISSPLINKKELWEISGHWEHYKENMFIANMGENEIYGIKAMNCPNAMLVFKHKTRSYKDLPLKLSDKDILHRYELSGTLSGLLRVRSFTQDDAHIFVTIDQIEEQYKEILEIADKFYRIFKLDYKLRLGTRPEKYMGEIKTWDKAERILKNILENEKREHNREYYIEEGDGAFYGPKIDIIMKDCLNREWQMGTIQLDFQQPLRFDLKYTDKDDKLKTPVVIHRVIYGSFERFIGILIEHYAGKFPLWLSPIQVTIMTVNDTHIQFAKELYNELKLNDIRVELDDRTESIGKKVRDNTHKKINYLITIGEKEIVSKKLAIRTRENKVIELSKEEFIKKILEEIKNAE